MKLWIDDVRPMPQGFDLIARTSAAALRIIEYNVITFISFDHDLGDDDTAYLVAAKIEELAAIGKMPRVGWQIHSANPIGRQRIEAAMLSAERFWNENKDSSNQTEEITS